MTALRKYIIAGLLVWLPLIITVVTIKFVVDLLDGTILLLPPEYRPEALLGFSIPGAGIVLAVGVLVLTGMFAANLLGRRLVLIWEKALGKIPLVRNIYNSVKQIATTLLASQSKSFRKVVLVEYPRKDSWCIGFLVNEQLDTDRAITDLQLQSNLPADHAQPHFRVQPAAAATGHHRAGHVGGRRVQVHHIHGSYRARRKNQTAVTGKRRRCRFLNGRE